MKHCPGKRIEQQIVGKVILPYSNKIFLCLKRNTCQHYYVKGEEMEMKDNCDEYQPIPPEAA